MGYDAGLLNDFGGGNVSWWHDYIRSELARSEEYWRDEITRYENENTNLEVENKKLREIIEECRSSSVDG